MLPQSETQQRITDLISGLTDRECARRWFCCVRTARNFRLEHGLGRRRIIEIWKRAFEKIVGIVAPDDAVPEFVSHYFDEAKRELEKVG